MKPRSRRWFLSGTAVLGGAGFLGGCRRGGPSLVSATGTAFGTGIGLTFLPPDRESSPRLLEDVFAEIGRLEGLFTLSEPTSALRRLNATGELVRPPAELVAVLRLCDEVHRLTGGAFDPTVQPLWELYESHFARHPLDEEGPPPDAIAEARNLVGWKGVEFDDSRIRLTVPGMKLTLNGVAPGFTADAAAEKLDDAGVRHALVDCGEFRSLGPQPDGTPWRVDIRGPGTGNLLGHVGLEGNAVATSAGYATAFDLEARFHHLFHPAADTFQPADQVIVVEAPRAALADALATAGGVMGRDALSHRIGDLPGTRVTGFPDDPAG